MATNLEDLLNVTKDSQVTIEQVLLAVTLAFILGVLISSVYRKTFRGISYSQSFIASVSLLSPITCIVMLTIGSNLARAFGLVGALSIIRFRTVIKDTKDIAVVFLSLVAGLTVGTQNYHIAIIGTLLVLLFMYLMDRLDYGSFNNNSYLISFSVPQSNLQEEEYNNIFDRRTRSHHIMNISSQPNGDMELTYKVDSVSPADRQALYNELVKMKGIEHLTIVSAKNYVEY